MSSSPPCSLLQSRHALLPGVQAHPARILPTQSLELRLSFCVGSLACFRERRGHLALSLYSPWQIPARALVSVLRFFVLALPLRCHVQHVCLRLAPLSCIDCDRPGDDRHHLADVSRGAPRSRVCGTVAFCLHQIITHRVLQSTTPATAASGSSSARRRCRPTQSSPT